jgi:hypothetical protein
VFETLWFLERLTVSTFDLVELDNKSILAAYQTLQSALHDIWLIMLVDGEQRVTELQLQFKDELGHSKVVAEGKGLVKLATLTHPPGGSAGDLLLSG